MENKELFDTIAGDYDELLPRHVVKHYLSKRIDFLTRRVGLKGLKVLDVGCGTGAILKGLGSAGCSRFGLDESPGMLGKAYSADIRLACGRSASMPFKDGQFDVVFCVAVLHHLYDPKTLAGTISEIIRVTRNGGRIVLWDHNPMNPYWIFLMKRMPQDRGHTRTVFAGEIKKYLLNNGVKVDKIYRMGWVPDFVPEPMLGLFAFAEKIMEKIPLVKLFSAHNVFLISK